jgi:hypothetical protein
MLADFNVKEGAAMSRTQMRAERLRSAAELPTVQVARLRVNVNLFRCLLSCLTQWNTP